MIKISSCSMAWSTGLPPARQAPPGTCRQAQTVRPLALSTIKLRITGITCSTGSKPDSEHDLTEPGKLATGSTRSGRDSESVNLSEFLNLKKRHACCDRTV